MITHNCKQGSQEWLELRASVDGTASEASAMLGKSPYTSRTDLLTQKKTGITPEIDEFTQKRFDKGHAIEAFARPLAEKVIGEELYPVTGSNQIAGLNLLASFDGLTMMEDTAWECKTLNEENKSVKNGVIPEHYYYQLEQQLMVSGAERVIFTVSDGTEDNTFHAEYKSHSKIRKEIITNWKQFKDDLKTFEPVAKEVKPEVKTIAELPSLSIMVKGEVTGSNLALYKLTAIEFIESINTDLKTDDDFAQAENIVKFCSKAEKALGNAKESALAQTITINEVFKTIDSLKEQLRKKRLFLDKLVKSKKEEIKLNMITSANAKFNEFISSINTEFTPIFLPQVVADFATAIKGKREIKYIQDAIDTKMADLKISTNEIALLIRSNLAYIRENASDYKFLFNDLQSLITKQNDDFILLVNYRLKEHKQAEQAKAEAEKARIEAEAKAKAEREAQAKIDAEREKIREQEQAKAKAEAEAKEAVATPIEVENLTPNPDGFIIDDIKYPEVKQENHIYYTNNSTVKLNGEFTHNDLLGIVNKLSRKAA